MASLSEDKARQYRRFLADELRSAAVYRALGRADRDPERAATFHRLADDEMRHASRWASLLGLRGDGLRPARLGFTGLLINGFARLLGTARVVGFLVRGEHTAIREYWGLDEGRDMAVDERRHAQTLRHMRTGGSEDGETALRAHPESGFMAGEGGTLRAAVLGINDGLVSNFSLVMGVAGGVTDPGIVLLAGVAGLLAGAFSMAAGEYISMRSQRDVYEAMIREERAEIELWPDEEQAELSRVYQSKGLTEVEADAVARRIMSRPDVALETMVREELGLDPDDLGSPWGAAISSMAAFTAGALVPIIPYLAGGDGLAFMLSATLSAAALVVVGAGLAWFSGINAAWGGLRMLLFGGAAAAVTYAIGRAIGVAI